MDPLFIPFVTGTHPWKLLHLRRLWEGRLDQSIAPVAAVIVRDWAGHGYAGDPLEGEAERGVASCFALARAGEGRSVHA